MTVMALTPCPINSCQNVEIIPYFSQNDEIDGNPIGNLYADNTYRIASVAPVIAQYRMSNAKVFEVTPRETIDSIFPTSMFNLLTKRDIVLRYIELNIYSITQLKVYTAEGLFNNSVVNWTLVFDEEISPDTYNTLTAPTLCPLPNVTLPAHMEYAIKTVKDNYVHMKFAKYQNDEWNIDNDDLTITQGVAINGNTEIVVGLSGAVMYSLATTDTPTLAPMGAMIASPTYPPSTGPPITLPTLPPGL